MLQPQLESQGAGVIFHRLHFEVKRHSNSFMAKTLLPEAEDFRFSCCKA